MADSNYETILVEREGRVGIITLNRPQALNALHSQMMNEVTSAAIEFDDDPGIGAIIITGSAKAFAAGADIKEMSDLTFADAFGADFFAPWGKLAAVRTPTIAAVAGHALGGGCELAMMCDVLIAAETAKFGQPEIKLGVLPGMGGSQRLTRAIGKAKAMDLILTGRTIGAAEGLVFIWFSLTPSLLPRGPLFQGVVSGCSGAIGYGLGVFTVWLVRYMRSENTSPPPPRWAWLPLAAVGLVGQVIMAIRFHVWQD